MSVDTKAIIAAVGVLISASLTGVGLLLNINSRFAVLETKFNHSEANEKWQWDTINALREALTHAQRDITILENRIVKEDGRVAKDGIQDR